MAIDSKTDGGSPSVTLLRIADLWVINNFTQIDDLDKMQHR